MVINQVSFIGSSTDPAKCPEPLFPEYAFIGRSNVGKSSLINMLVKRRALAKVSGKPGKTQTINHFMVNNAWYLVDLPGYGYARVSKQDKSRWHDFSLRYIENRTNLMTLFTLIDSRLEPQAIDLDFLFLLGEARIPFALVYTKTDKVSRNQLNHNQSLMIRELSKDWEILPPFYHTSATGGLGRDELLGYIDTTNKLFVKP